MNIQSQIIELLEEIKQHNEGIPTAAMLEGVFITFGYSATSSELLGAFFAIHKPSAKGRGYMDMTEWAGDNNPVESSFWMFPDGSMFYQNKYIEGAINP